MQVAKNNKNKMQTEPGNYIWRSSSSDFPVTVISNMGKGPDGRYYVKIAESSTSIPADELVKIDNQESRKPKSTRLFS